MAAHLSTCLSVNHLGFTEEGAEHGTVSLPGELPRLRRSSVSLSHRPHVGCSEISVRRRPPCAIHGPARGDVSGATVSITLGLTHGPLCRCK